METKEFESEVEPFRNLPKGAERTISTYNRANILAYKKKQKIDEDNERPKTGSSTHSWGDVWRQGANSSKQIM